MKYTEIRNLADLGLITPEQADAVAARFRLSPREPRNYPLIAFSLLGGLLALAGAALLVSANWEATPPLVKQISCAGLMLAAWAAGLRFLLRAENPRPIFGEALCLVGAGMWLSNIALYGQIYQISSEPSRAFGAWFLGIFLLPLLVRLRGVFAASLLAAGFWAGYAVVEHGERFGDTGKNLFFCLFAFFAAVSALGIFLGELNEGARERVRGYGPIALWTAFPLMILFAQVFCYEEIQATASAAAMVVPASALLVASLLFSFRKKLGAGGRVLAVIVGAFPLFTLALGFLEKSSDGRVSDNLIHASAAGSLFVCGVAAMALGAIVARRFFVNAGTLMILFAALALVMNAANVLGSLTGGGLALVFGGAGLLASAFFLERRRRDLVGKIAPREND